MYPVELAAEFETGSRLPPVTAGVGLHIARHHSTRQMSRVCVGRAYWVLTEAQVNWSDIYTVHNAANNMMITIIT